MTRTAAAAGTADSAYSCIRSYYVDATQGSDAEPDGGTAELPWKTIGRALLGRSSGDCVTVRPGTYVEAVTIGTGHETMTPAGDPAARYLVLRAAPEGRVLIEAPLDSHVYNLVDIRRSYVVVQGLDVDGRIEAGGATGSCIAAEQKLGPDPASPGPAHIRILDNLVHDCGGGGIQLAYGDDYLIAGNQAYRNACCNRFQMSGISIFEPVEAGPARASEPGTAEAPRIRISRNISHDNQETDRAGPDGNRTDGNGIIIDDFQNTQRAIPGPVYGARTEVDHNVVYGNGGSGIQVSRSDRVTVDHNTGYGDNRDLGNHAHWRGDIAAMFSHDVDFDSNIAVSTPAMDGPRAFNVAYLFEGGDGLRFHGNLSFADRGDPRSLSKSILAAGIDASNHPGSDPHFVSVVPPDIDLRLRRDSAVYGLGIGFETP